MAMIFASTMCIGPRALTLTLALLASQDAYLKEFRFMTLPPW